MLAQALYSGDPGTLRHLPFDMSQDSLLWLTHQLYIRLIFQFSPATNEDLRVDVFVKQVSCAKPLHGCFYVDYFAYAHGFMALSLCKAVIIGAISSGGTLIFH